jgi:hypothetical protein
MDVVVFTSDKHLWAVKPFSILFNKYWSEHQQVIVVGYKFPEFDLPSNFLFYSISDTEYPANRWVKGAIEFLDDYNPPSNTFVLFHEDYFLMRHVDIDGVESLNNYVNSEDDLFRIDLTTDRLYAGGMVDIGSWNRFDIIEAPQSPYQMSHQATIVKKDKYLKLLKSLDDNHQSAWEVELEGTTYVNNNYGTMKVVGTRQYPVRYANALLKGKLDIGEMRRLKNYDMNLINGYIPESYK